MDGCNGIALVVIKGKYDEVKESITIDHYPGVLIQDTLL